MDFSFGQLRSNTTHARVDIVPAVTALERMQLTGKVFLVLSRERRRLDWTAGVEAVARIAGGKSARGIAALDIGRSLET
jgi:hypothetical protein